MSQRRSIVLWILAAALLQTAAHAQQVPSAWVIGGQSGVPWAEPVLHWIALDDSTRDGALQLQEIPSDQNVLGERVRLSAVTPRNIFQFKWTVNKGRYALEADTLLLGWHPRVWYGGGANATGSRTLVDGDELTPGLTTASNWVTLDLGVPIAVDSVVFFPPQNGFNSNGDRLRDLFHEAYEVSRTNEAAEWLLFEDETISTGSAGYHALDEIIASTFSNSQSIVGLSMPLRFTRFIRFKLGGVGSSGVLTEIKAFGAGYPAEGRYVSRPHFFDQPVSLGKITWEFTKYRKTGSGEIVEDPAAPVQLIIRTRAGDDPDPEAYFIYDELGRKIEVDRETFFDAQPPRGIFDEGLAAYRAAVTDDIGNWNAWSIAYRNSGDEIRSSDGREYLQFQFDITTEDPLAFGVLDSLAFELSPLLADSVLAEVSLEGQPEPPGKLIEVPLGVDTVFVYDLRTVFSDNRKPGFDGIELDVPLGAQFLDMEIDGAPAVEGEDFSLLSRAEGRLAFAFPHRFTEDASFRVRFRSAIFQASVFLGGNIVDLDPETVNLPQSIEGGDARADVSSDDIQVVSAQTRLTVLGNLRLDPPVLTPNGDGINDETEIDFAVFGVEEAGIQVGIYDLSGRLVADLSGMNAGAGRYQPTWDGKDGSGSLVPPGLYLVRVEVDVDEDTFAELRSVAVVY